MLFYLQEDAQWRWDPADPKAIPLIRVRPILYLSRCLSAAETRYGPSELEVACLVWAAKKLRTMLQSANLPVVVLTDYSATKGIVEQTNLSTSSTDRVNKRFVNASIYLLQYSLRVYHLPGRLNVVPDALSRLRAVQDKEVDSRLHRTDKPPVLDTVWFMTEAIISPEIKEKFAKGYDKDACYSAIIKDVMDNYDKVATGFFRAGYPFEIVDGLLYNVGRGKDSDRRLYIPHDLIPEFMAMAHDDKHHFGRDRMLHELESFAIRNKTYLVKQYINHCVGCDHNQTDR